MNTMLQRRNLLKTAGAGAAAATAMSLTASPAAAQSADIDFDILNFALNLEYLEAEFYARGVFGFGLPATSTSGAVFSGGTAPRNNVAGNVLGGRKVTFQTEATYELLRNIAIDEISHVAVIREALAAAPGAYLIPEPPIDLFLSFTALAQTAGLIAPGEVFDPFANENNFLLAAYIFEDVGVTAYAGAAALITNKDYLTTAARILAVEAYHASSLRDRLYLAGYAIQTDKISNLRASLSGTGTGFSLPPDDHGTYTNGISTIANVNAQGLIFTRTPGQVLNIAYFGSSTSGGGFFPQGVNGNITLATVNPS